MNWACLTCSQNLLTQHEQNLNSVLMNVKPALAAHGLVLLVIVFIMQDYL